MSYVQVKKRPWNGFGSASTRIWIACEYCHTQVFRDRTRALRSKHHFCNKDCEAAFRKQSAAGASQS